MVYKRPTTIEDGTTVVNASYLGNVFDGIDEAKAAAGSGGGVSKSLRLRDLPAPSVIDAIAPLTTTIVANTSATSIASGVVAASMPAPGGLLSMIGCKATDLVNASGSGLYAPRWKAASDGTSGSVAFNTSSFGVDLMVAGSRYIEFQVAVSGSYAIKILVDDKPITDFPVVPAWAANVSNTVKVDLVDVNPHRVRLMVNNAAIGNVWVSPGGAIWATKLKGPRLFVLGDSLTQGTQYNTGLELGTWLHRFAAHLGIDDYWNGGIAGTGPTTPASGYPAYTTRATNDAVPSGADIVIVGSHYNSRTDTAANVQAAMSSIISALQAMPSAPQIVVFGAPDPTGVNAAPFPAMDSAVAATCAAKGVAYISPLTGLVFSSSGVQVFAGGPWFTAANKGSFISAGDNVHPTDAGHKYFERRMLESYKSLLAA